MPPHRAVVFVTIAQVKVNKDMADELVKTVFTKLWFYSIVNPWDERLKQNISFGFLLTCYDRTALNPY